MTNQPYTFLGGDARGDAFSFVVEPFSEDCAGSLSWKFFGNQLLRCASLHAGRRGFGFADMMRHRHVWVLSRLVIDLERMPRTGEAYTIETWVSRVFRQFTDRQFAITSPDGFNYGFASSTWALIDLDSRTSLDLENLPEGSFADMTLDKDTSIGTARRVRLKEAEPIKTYQAGYSDLDINGHVNSIRYIETALDLFPVDRFDTHHPARIEALYTAEAYAGDTLLYYMTPVDETTHLVEIRRQHDGLPVFKAAIVWKPL